MGKLPRVMTFGGPECHHSGGHSGGGIQRALYSAADTDKEQMKRNIHQVEVVITEWVGGARTHIPLAVLEGKMQFEMRLC